MATSTSAIQVTSYYKPGGTATIALNKWSGRVNEQIHDKTGQGRWSGFKLRAHRPIIVVTAYRVPQTSIDQVGHKTAYAQQWAVARMAGEPTPEPREQTITDLTKEIHTWQQTSDVIIMIDANEQMTHDKSGISQLAQTCNLIDIIATTHPQANRTATYSRGTKRIDFILISHTLTQHVTGCGLLAFFDGIHSDHRGSFVDFTAKGVFQETTPTLYTQPTRQLHSKKPSSVLTYKTELWKQLQAHNIMSRSKTIMQQATNQATNKDSTNTFTNELNNIADTMQHAMLRAETRCAKTPPAPYSVKLANLNKVIRYWKTRKSALKTKRDATYQLQQLKQELPPSDHAKLVKQFSVQTHIRKAITEYNNELPNAKQHRQDQIYEWADAAAKRGNNTAAQHFRSMAYAEDMKETFRILKNLTKPQDRTGLKKIDIPATNEAGEALETPQGNAIMTTISDPTRVEELLLDRNREHFGQAQGTPFTGQAIIDIFGVDGSSTATDDLITGNYHKA